MADNVIKAVFASGRRVKTAPLWRYDHGIRLQPIGLKLPDTYEMHFSNSKTGEATTVLADASGAVIPAEYLIPGTEVYAWIYLVGDTYGRTRAEIIIPVDAKARPTDQEPTPEQESVLEQAIDALNDAVDGIPEQINTALAAAKASGEFDGEDGNSIWWTGWEIADVSMAGRIYGQILKSRLSGRTGEPAVHDLVVGPPVGTSGAASYLYEITSAGTMCQLKGIGSIKGDTGPQGPGYILTDEDMEEIVGDVLAELPKWNGGLY